jgi:hypothetical protein
MTEIYLNGKADTMAVAYNDHFRIKAIENAIENLKLLAERIREQGNN